MNRKINTLCFIFLFLFLISAVSAADCENETIKTISKSDTQETLQISDVENTILEQSIEKTTLNATKVTKQKVTLSAANVDMYYMDGHKFSVTLKDKDKKAIRNAKIKISIDGSTYTQITDTKGTVSINLHLKSGKYNVVSAFDGTSIHEKASVKSTVNIKSTMKCSDFTKFYKNPTPYSATFYDKNGKILKNTVVAFKINGKTYYSKTNNNGIAKQNINFRPGKFTIALVNSKTGEAIFKIITVKSVIETKDLTTTEDNKANFNVKILDCYGKASPNKKVILKVDGKTYTKTTNKNGQITLPLYLEVGQHTIITEYDDLKVSNKITVNKLIKTSSFKHITTIPNYVNVTIPYVYSNAKYSLKVGINGTVKMPKIELITVQIGSRTYQFTTGKTNDNSITAMEEKSYFVPFDGGLVLSSKNKNLNIDGIIITRLADSTEIEYRSKTGDNVELFGFYADKGGENSEIFTYIQNDKTTAKVSIQTQYFDETGVKYSLAKYYRRVNMDFAYYEITNHVANPIKFTNTGKAVTFSYFERNIIGYNSKEEIMTRFIIDGKEELEKRETISYGLGENYRRALGFEVLQSYTIISEKISQKTVEDWISKNSNYINKFGVMNLYGMHLASLETVWLADELADKYAKEFNVTWKRNSAVTILGGINLEDTYLNILDADMAMTVKGNEKNVVLFRLVNSLNLPNIEDYALTPVSERFMDNTTNSIDNVFTSIKENNFSMVQLGELLYVFSKDNSSIILNTTSGVASVIHYKNNATYKGSSICTSKDCCSVGIIPKDIITGIKNSIKIFAPGIYVLSDKLDKIHPLSVLGYLGAKNLLGYALNGASSSCLSLFTTMTMIQTGGTTYRNTMVDEKDWHKLMDSVTFTRPGYLQSKKVYNIPNKKGGYDYVEVKIKNDLTLDRKNAIYISNGKTKKLTVAETYKYFCEDYWTPFSMPMKYWDDSWRK